MINKVFHHIKLISVLLVFAGILASGFLVWKLEGRQSYTARAVIQAKKLDIETGLMPDGVEFPAEGFLSESVLSQVITDCTLDSTVEELREQITVKEYLESAKQTQLEALLKDGKDLETFPDEYQITVEAESEEEAYQICDALLIAYRSWYEDRYVTLQNLENPAEVVLSDNNMEPVTALDRLSEECTDLKTYLNYKKNDSPSFRSVTTGYSMQDLYDRLALTEDTITDLYADAYSGAVGTNPELLLQAIQSDIEAAEAERTRTQEETDAVKTIMDTYADKMKESYRDSDVRGETSYYMVEEFVEEGNRYTGANAKTTYDSLIEEYVNLLIKQEKERAKIDNLSMISSFYSDENAWEEQTGIAARTEKSKETLLEEIRENAKALSDLYQTVCETNQDYRNYLYQSHIKTNGSIGTSAMVNTRLYSLIAVAFGMMCCFGAIAALIIGKRFLSEKGVLESC